MQKGCEDETAFLDLQKVVILTRECLAKGNATRWPRGSQRWPGGAKGWLAPGRDRQFSQIFVRASFGGAELWPSGAVVPAVWSLLTLWSARATAARKNAPPRLHPGEAGKRRREALEMGL